ncbi:MAG: hypothetical protein Q9157_006582 [Trypethelium eluteriae]
MSESQTKRPRITPRNSSANGDPQNDETPYSNVFEHKLRFHYDNLQDLSDKTRRLLCDALKLQERSQQVKSRKRRLRRSPGRQQFGAMTELVEKRQRLHVQSPHSDVIAMQLRRQVIEDGVEDCKGRHRGMFYDHLAMLSRNTQPIEPSPQAESTKPSAVDDDWIDDPDLPAPRLSMPLNELEDDDSFHIDPPQMSSQFEDDDNITAQSFEGPRRAFAEMGNSRLSRGSLGGLRISDQFGDLKNAMDVSEFDENVREDNDVTDTIPRLGLDDGTLTLNAEYVTVLLLRLRFTLMTSRESTQEMRALLDVASRRQSRLSDATPYDLANEELDPTFLFALPEAQEANLVVQGAPVASSRSPSDDAPIEDDTPTADDAPVAEALGDSEPMGNFNSDEDEIEEPEEYSDHESLDAVNEAALLGGTLAAAPMAGLAKKPAMKPRKRREIKVSRHGTEYPSLPSSVVKRVASGFTRANGGGIRNLSREMVAALSQATEWFFEQVSEDLASYSEHGGRKTIDEADVMTLMRRQRLLNTNTTAFSLAQKNLPRELLQAIRFGPSVKSKRRKRARLDTIREEDEE